MNSKAVAVTAGSVGAVGLGFFLWMKSKAKAKSLESITVRYANLSDVKHRGTGLGGALNMDVTLAVNNASRVDMNIRVLSVRLLNSAGSALAQSVASSAAPTKIPQGSQAKFTIPVEMPWMEALSFVGGSIADILLDSGKAKILDKIKSKFKGFSMAYDADVNGIPMQGKLDLGKEEEKKVEVTPTAGLALSAGPRNVADASQYNSLFPAPINGDEVIIPTTDVDRTARTVLEMVKKRSFEVRRMADFIWDQSGGDQLKYCRLVFSFLYTNLQYRNDRSGSEQIVSPAQAWQEGQVQHKQEGKSRSGIDCDDFTVSVCSYLREKGIPYRARIAGYSRNGFQHIYAVAIIGGKEVPIDPVVDKFGWEKPIYMPFKRTFDENGKIL